MGFFERLANVWKGFLSLWVSDVESRNPDAVYEAAINERVKKHLELKKAVSGIVYLRNKLSAELEQAEKELKEVMTQLPIAVEEGEDEVAIVLIQRKDSHFLVSSSLRWMKWRLCSSNAKMSSPRSANRSAPNSRRSPRKPKKRRAGCFSSKARSKS